MFIGRKQELQALEKRYQSGKFEMPVIYGRRRIGKTTLINAFIQNKPVIYFTGLEGTATQNLVNFSNAIAAFSGLPDGAIFPNFQIALEHVFQLAQQQRVVLVMDEYPYVARVVPELSFTLQMLVDKHQETSQLYIILCGSSMSFMEEKVLSYQAPLYGRRTAQIKLEAMNFFEARQFLPGFTPAEQALLYGCVGGTPRYLVELNNQLSIQENLCHTFFDPTSFLFEEPANLLKQELREPAYYNAILTAIAGGASRQSEISDKAMVSREAGAAYLKNLISLRIVEKESPVGEKLPKRVVYRITDPLFRFWYRFIPNNLAWISRGLPDYVWQRVAPQLDTFMGPVFEEICRSYLWRELTLGRIQTVFTNLGRWWGTDPRLKQQTEVDIIGPVDDTTLLCGECKWRHEKTDQHVLEDLVRKSQLFPHPHKELWLFSRSGFTRGCAERAAALGNVHLVAFADMV